MDQKEKKYLSNIHVNQMMKKKFGNQSLMIKLNRRNIYFVPFGQDDPEKKPHSLVADFSLLEATLENALEANQIKRIFL